MPDSSLPLRRHPLRDVLLYGLCSGLLIAVLGLAQYRFLVVEHAVEVYGGIIAFVFTGLGTWVGLSVRQARQEVVERAPAPPAEPGAPFAPDPVRLGELGITPRELEILGLIAAGMSNREIAGRLFVSENTVKTHSGRLLEKLGAKRRTQAVQIARASRLIA